MQYRSLGTTGIDVSVIGIGYWAVADPGIWGEQDERDAIDAVHAALDAGITFFDTAETYGKGYSEELLGRALAGRRSEAIVATKAAARNLGRAALVKACERSLRRLQIDTIDLYQLHWPRRTIPLDETFEALARLHADGKIRAVGLSNFGPQDLAAALQAAAQAGLRVASNQLAYNLLFRAIEFEIAAPCLANAISILPYSPLLHGLLTGKFATLDDVPPERARTRHFSRRRPGTRHRSAGAEAETAAALDAMRRISTESDLPMSELALAWLIAQPGVTAVIAGARTAHQARRNAAAAQRMLPPDVLRALDNATAPLKAALGPNADMWVAGKASRMR